LLQLVELEGIVWTKYPVLCQPKVYLKHVLPTPMFHSGMTNDKFQTFRGDEIYRFLLRGVLTCFTRSRDTCLHL